MKATFQIDLDNVNEVAELKELLERRLSQIQNQESDLDNQISTTSTNPSYSNEQVTSSEKNNIDLLRLFVSQASKNQIKVLEWMKANPGSVSAHILKNDLPFLAPHGSLSGVFRPGRWLRLSGGTKVGFPFFQIEWNHEKGCGIYRGLTQEEANALDL
ncbi:MULTISPECIES: hypothetical protein [Bacillus cereus group]|uniref:hypothetical protein n=1 Tax=Bacillus cereus group TaxID=86661 RepID=UPI001F2A431D|nr:hypothetical protein [Bacillus cereus]MDA1521524.1 hypothetical protein [Bacillus cereus]BCC09444.1 hypothetical protein BCM0060_p2110 [Bacillus cereus]BCC16664.1 hypothetical protein BCM0075_1434 [Bacillus cereus]BCC50458.1 hypothetical protein BCJMU02_p2052 [Bacillus cereus]BCD08859.1 hypothetical protein BC30052_p2141 [Bacillus cereus]